MTDEKTDEELGMECGRRLDAACKGMRIDLLVSWQRQKLGAMVRLIRQARDYVKTVDCVWGPDEEYTAWLSEALELVGEEEAK